MSSSNIKNICFIGAGTMGCFNSLVASVAGYACKIFDQSEDVLNERLNNQTFLAQYLNQFDMIKSSRQRNYNFWSNYLPESDFFFINSFQ